MTTMLHDVQAATRIPAGAYWVPSSLGGSAPTLAEAKVLDEAELARRADATDRSLMTLPL